MFRFSVFGYAILAAAAFGCGSSGDQRVEVKGSIKVDGQPMEIGVVTLLPMDGQKRKSGGVIRAGEVFIPAAEGPNAGKYRVEIRWLKRTGKKSKSADTGEMQDEFAEGLPDEFHKDSKLTWNFASGSNALDFDLKVGK